MKPARSPLLCDPHSSVPPPARLLLLLLSPLCSVPKLSVNCSLACAAGRKRCPWPVAACASARVAAQRTRACACPLAWLLPLSCTFRLGLWCVCSALGHQRTRGHAPPTCSASPPRCVLPSWSSGRRGAARCAAAAAVLAGALVAAAAGRAAGSALTLAAPPRPRPRSPHTVRPTISTATPLTARCTWSTWVSGACVVRAAAVCRAE